MNKIKQFLSKLGFGFNHDSQNMNDDFTKFLSGSKLNATVYKSRRQLILSIIIMIISFIFLLKGCSNFNYDVAHSSSPRGSKMTFTRSKASLSLNDIFITKNQDALIARLSPDSLSDVNLPFKGENYNLYIQSPSLNKFSGEFLSTVFVKLSTTGDFFLIIPYPDNNVYTVSIMNKEFIASSSTLGDTSSSVSSKLTEEQIQKSLSSQLRGLRVNLNPQEVDYTIKSDDYDVIAMRLTKNPAIDNQNFKPEVLDIELFNENKELQFEKLFNVLYKGSLQQQVLSNLSGLDTLIKQETIHKKDLEDRNLEGSSPELIQTIQQSERQLQKLKNKRKDILQTVELYEKLKYNPDTMFKYPKTKAYILEE